MPKTTTVTDLAAAKAALAPFLAANPASTVEEVENRLGVKEVLILNPWGDASVGIRVPNEFKALSDTLNTLVLPQRLAAVWHSDSNKLEVIFTALNLTPAQSELKDRKFVFEYKNQKHACEYARSSDRLLEIAKHVFPRTNSVLIGETRNHFQVILGQSQKTGQDYH